jgi:hypothetical protein
MPEDFPQYYTPNPAGLGQGLAKTIADNLEVLEASHLRARAGIRGELPLTKAVLDGVPGIIFERGAPNPDVFFQGDDIVYDVFLAHDGKKVLPEDFAVLVRVKTSPRSQVVVYSASLEDGIYYGNTPGVYELWIPSAITENLLAGTYHLQIQLVERVGTGRGRHDRKFTVLQHHFNIDYGTFSDHVEASNTNQNNLTRAAADSTWPNQPNTLGR